MKNKLLKTISILLVAIIVSSICSISFASSITTANIKESIKKVLTNEIFIKGSDNSLSTMNGGENELDIITDSTIGGKIEGVEYNLFNYSVEDNYCILNANIETFYNLLKIDTSKLSKDELETAKLVIALFISMYMENMFIAASDAVGQNLSVALSYYLQQMEPLIESDIIDVNLNNDIFSLIMSSNDKYILETATLRINLDKLSTLTESQIDKTKTTYKVFIGQLPDSEKENIETQYKIDSISNKVYTGKAIKPSVSIVEKVSGFEAYLENGTDYKVTYSNNVNTGKATVTVTGNRLYKGKLTKTFYIVPKKVEGVKVTKQAKTSVTLQWTKNGGNISKYKVYYYDYSKKAWKYSGKTESNSYQVKDLKDGTTYKFRVRAYKSIDGNQYFGAYSTSVRTSTKTKTPKITNLIKGKKKITAKFNKVSNADGYKIEYSTDKKFQKNTKSENVSKKSTSKTISKLKSNKKYYVRIRAYRKVDGKKIYSSYSETKSIITK